MSGKRSRSRVGGSGDRARQRARPARSAPPPQPVRPKTAKSEQKKKKATKATKALRRQKKAELQTARAAPPPPPLPVKAPDRGGVKRGAKVQRTGSRESFTQEIIPGGQALKSNKAIRADPRDKLHGQVAGKRRAILSDKQRDARLIASNRKRVNQINSGHAMGDAISDEARAALAEQAANEAAAPTAMDADVADAPMETVTDKDPTFTGLSRQRMYDPEG